MTIYRIIESVEHANKLLSSGWTMVAFTKRNIEKTGNNHSMHTPISSFRTWQYMATEKMFLLELKEATKCTDSSFSNHEGYCDICNRTGFVKQLKGEE